MSNDPKPAKSTDTKEFANDVDRSIGALLDMVANAKEAQNSTDQMPIDPRTFMDNMVRPQLYQYAQEKPETAMKAVAVVHRASADLLDKHSDSDPNDLL